MAKLNLPQNEIRIQLPDFQKHETRIIREAYCSSLVYDTDAKQVKVIWVVQHFSKGITGSKGEYLGNVIPDYLKTITATNEVMCDATTGVPLADDSDLQNYEGDYTGQYDFFCYLAENSNIVVHDMIRQFGALTDWSV